MSLFNISIFNASSPSRALWPPNKYSNIVKATKRKAIGMHVRREVELRSHEKKQFVKNIYS